MAKAKGTIRQRRGVRAVVLHALATVPEPRRRSDVAYPLPYLLLIGLGTALTGPVGWQAMADFAETHRAWTAQWFEIAGATPDADVFAYVFARVAPAAVEAALGQWLGALGTAPRPGELIALDGKALRGTAGADGVCLHLLQAYATARGVVLGQRLLDSVGEEARAAPELLRVLELEGAVVSMDAAGCTAPIAAAIDAGGADYLLTVKANRAVFFEHVTQYVADAEAIGFAGLAHATARTEDHGHGRTEVREVLAVDARDAPLRGVELPRLRTVARITRTRTDATGTTTHVWYHVTSLRPDAARIGRLVRDHWQVENHLHWHLDVALAEDACRVRERTGARTLATFRRAGLALLRRDTTQARSIARKQRYADHHPEYLNHLLTLGNSRD